MRKFLFDTAFSADGAILNEAAPKRPVYTEADLEAARTEAFAAGFADGRKEAAHFSAKLHTEALSASAGEIRALFGQIDAAMATLKADAAELALAVGRTIAANALDRFGEDNAKAIIAAATDELRHASTVRLVAAPEIVSAMTHTFEAQGPTLPCGLSITCQADPAMKPGAVRLEFASGEIAFDPGEIARNITAAFSHHLSARDDAS